MVEQFHQSRREEYFSRSLAWDTGTRERKATLAKAHVADSKDIGADGINFDTLESVPPRLSRKPPTPSAIRWPLSLNFSRATNPSPGPTSAGTTG